MPSIQYNLNLSPPHGVMSFEKSFVIPLFLPLLYSKHIPDTKTNLNLFFFKSLLDGYLI